MISKGSWLLGKVMLESQSKTVNLSQLPEEQAPLLLQPKGNPFIVVEQELQLIIYIYFELRITPFAVDTYIILIQIFLL